MQQSSQSTRTVSVEKMTSTGSPRHTTLVSDGPAAGLHERRSSPGLLRPSDAGKDRRRTSENHSTTTVRKRSSTSSLTAPVVTSSACGGGSNTSNGGLAAPTWKLKYQDFVPAAASLHSHSDWESLESFSYVSLY